MIVYTLLKKTSKSMRI